MIDIISMVLIGIGCFLSLIGALGLVRLPDFYARLHAVGVTDTLCSFLILLGLAFQSGFQLSTMKLLFIFIFLIFASPTASFALSNTAWRWGVKTHKGEPK